jgi:hypothetical protein
MVMKGNAVLGIKPGCKKKNRFSKHREKIIFYHSLSNIKKSKSPADIAVIAWVALMTTVRLACRYLKQEINFGCN